MEVLQLQLPQDISSFGKLVSNCVLEGWSTGVTKCTRCDLSNHRSNSLTGQMRKQTPGKKLVVTIKKGSRTQATQLLGHLLFPE